MINLIKRFAVGLTVLILIIALIIGIIVIFTTPTGHIVGLILLIIAICTAIGDMVLDEIE